MRRLYIVLLLLLVMSGLASAQTQVITIDEIRATSNLSVDAAGNSILPLAGYDQNLGSLSKKFLSLHAAELWVETLVAQSTLATIGGRVLVGPTSSLTKDAAAVDGYVCLKHNSFANGDRVYLESNGSIEFLALTSTPTTDHASCNADITDYYYTVTRNLDGSGANQWYAGDALFNTGTTGSGFLDLYSVRSVKSAVAGNMSEPGPTVVGNVRLSATYNDWAPRWAIGNLDGLYGYSGAAYGAAFGDPSDVNLTVDATNGVRMREGGFTRAQWAANGDVTIGVASGSSGNVFISNAGTLYARSGTTAGVTIDSNGVLVGQTGSGKSNVYISSGAVKLRTDETDKITLGTDGSIAVSGTLSIGSTGDIHSGTTTWASGTGFWLGYDSSYYKFRVGGTTGQRFSWDGQNLTVQAGNVVISPDGLYLPGSNSWDPDYNLTIGDVGIYGANGPTLGIVKASTGGSIGSFVVYADYSFLSGITVYGSTTKKIYPDASGWDLGTSSASQKFRDLYLSQDIFFGPTGNTADWDPLVFDSDYGVIRRKTDGYSGSGTSCTITAIESGIVTGASCS